MKTLILSANAGQGHNSCARAICEAYQAHGETCVMEDAFALLSPRLSESISRNHEKTYRQSPKQSDSSYRFLVAHPGLFAPGKPVYRVMSLGGGRIARCIREGGYDAVICTHALAAMMLTAAVQRRKLAVKTAFVATDHTCSPGINGTQLDRYFIPHAALAPLFLEAEVPAQAIVASGIPVRSAFAPAADKAALKERFSIQPASLHLLIMCGSMGCGPIPDLLEGISSRMPKGWEISVVCGTNEELYHKLMSRHQGTAAIHIHQYVQDMPLLLCASDLCLTKPGGLSTAEAAAAQVPMVLVDAVGGCEESNLRHFVRTGQAVTGKTREDVIRICLELMNDPDRLISLAASFPAQASCAAERIYQEMHQI